jgi:hypothetical protein
MDTAKNRETENKMTFDQSSLKPKYTPHNTLEEGWTYISVPDDDVIIGVKASVTKVMKIMAPDGTQAKDPSGCPMYSFQSVNVVKTLTREEYNVEKQRRNPK